MGVSLVGCHADFCHVMCRVPGTWASSEKKKKVIKLIYIFYQYFAGGYQFLGGGETPLRSAGQAIVWQNKYWQQNCKSWWNSTEGKGGKSSAPCRRVLCGYSKTKAKSRCKRNVTSQKVLSIVTCFSTSIRKGSWKARVYSREKWNRKCQGKYFSSKLGTDADG